SQRFGHGLTITKRAPIAAHFIRILDRSSLGTLQPIEWRTMIPKVRKAVFPAAGLGTRFLPATKAQPKEMLPVVDKPLIQYGVEEAIASGAENVIIVTARGKTSIEDHFDTSYELEQVLQAKKKTALLE